MMSTLKTYSLSVFQGSNPCPRINHKNIDKSRDRMDKIIIKEAGEDDFDQIFQLFKQLQPKEHLDKSKVRNLFNEILSSNKHSAWIALVDKKIVGYIDVVFRTYHFAFDFTARIETTVVDEKYRRKGIASKLISECEKKAKMKGCKVMEVDSGMQRENAHRTYESNGYSKRGYLFWKRL